MKKNLKFIIGLVVLVVVIGIVSLFVYIFTRPDVVECSSNIKETEYTINNKYKIYHKKEIVEKVLIEKEIESKNNTVLSFFENNYKEEFEKYNKDYGGYTISSKKDGNKMIVSIELDMKKVDIDKLKAKSSYLKDDIVKNKLKLEGIYKLYNLDKNRCK